MKLSRALSLAARGLGATLLVALVALSVSFPLPAELTQGPPSHSLRVEASDGSLLREARGTRGESSEWLKLEKCPKLLQDAIIAVEDRRFFLHPGIDPFSALRASWQALYNGRIVSGASTLSMQLARTLRPHPRTLWGKLGEVALALRIEGQLTKRQILEQYLNRVDFGPNLRGVVAAARGHFDKPVSALSVAEIALLTGLPQSPSRYAPARYPNRARLRRARVLQALDDAGIISPQVAMQATSESLHLASRRPAFGAPHFVASLLAGSLNGVQPNLDIAMVRRASRVKTTLEPLMQRQAEAAISSVLDGLVDQQVTAAALIAVDNATGDVLAYVGSPDFYNESIAGQVDGVLARRQPGSTLKPFVYGAAFEQLGYTPATVLPDLELAIETETGAYRPRNFDDLFRGPVRLREALGNSLNVPAVHTAARLGAPALLDYLHRFGFSSLNQSPEHYGPALALGDGEVTLLELVRAYLTLARGGSSLPLRLVTEMTVAESTPSGVVERTQTLRPGTGESVLPRSVAALLTDILKDPSARLASFGARSPLDFEFDVAVKTGTSKGFRDNWTVGYTSKLTVGVWAGNFDGSPMRQTSGITGAAPIFHAFVAATASSRAPEALPLSRSNTSAQLRAEYALTRVEVCPVSGQQRGALCPHGVFEYVPSSSELPTCEWHQELILDRRNGLLAGPDCPTGATSRQTFEVLPEPYGAWVSATRRPSAPRQFSPNCPEGATVDVTAPLRITLPANGSRFVVDPERARALQQLRFEAEAPASVDTLLLFVGNRKVAHSQRPFRFSWPLEAGVFRFVVATEQGAKSLPVDVEVRDVQGVSSGPSVL